MLTGPSTIATAAMATVISPSLNQWYSFDVDETVAQDTGLGWIDAQFNTAAGYAGDGSSLSFVFALSTTSLLTLVDSGYAGDVFGIWINGSYHQSNLVLPNSTAELGLEFESALLNPLFSQISILLSPGDYTITGELVQSALDDNGIPFNATVGGIRISSVDEPSILLLMLSLGSILFLHRHRRLAKREMLK